MDTNTDQISGSFIINDKDVKESFTIANNFVHNTAFHTNRLGKSQPPILVVTCDGDFQWHEDAESRIDLDDYQGFESLRFILKTLWIATNKNVQTIT